MHQRAEGFNTEYFYRGVQWTDREPCHTEQRQSPEAQQQQTKELQILKCRHVTHIFTQASQTIQTITMVSRWAPNITASHQFSA